MNRGLSLKAVRESWGTTLLLAAALTAIQAILAYVLPSFADQFASTWLTLDSFRNILRALLGTAVGDSIGPYVFSSIAWVHPVVLAIVGTQAAVFTTRLPAGEIDRGTIDLLLGLPVSRSEVYRSESAVFLASGVFVLVMGLVGNRVGVLLLDPRMRPEGGPAPVVLNLFCLYVAVGALGWLVSSLSDRRGKAIAIVFGILLASFLLNFLAPFWEPAEAVSFLSILDYYQPLFVLGDGAWPLSDMAVLVVVAIVLWTLAGWVLRRRDIATL